MDPEHQVLRLFLFDPPPAGLNRLRAALPQHTRTTLGLEIPLDGQAPEEILALCLRFGVTARATRILDRRPAEPSSRRGAECRAPSAESRAMKYGSETVHPFFKG
ncbi:MAG: hypothetical protein ACT4PM_07535 [Gemmatimonadales bacterium]